MLLDNTSINFRLSRSANSAVRLSSPKTESVNLARSHFISPEQLVLVIDGNVILVAKVVPEPAEGWVSWFFLAQRAWVSF